MFHRETDDIVFNKLKKIEKNIIKKENKEITDDLDASEKVKLDLEHGIWFRNSGYEIGDKYTELLLVLRQYTNYSNLKKEFVGELKRQHMEKKQCICSCTKCMGLFNTYHIPTGQTFAVGSSCINKFIDQFFIAKLTFIKNNGTCEMCHTFKVLRTTPDFKKNCNSKEDKLCFACIKPNMMKRVNQIHTMLYFREIVLEQKDEKVLYIENQTNMIALNIKYHEKDYYKERYGIVWNQDLKLWFINKCKIRHEKICDKIYLG
jgi:hypothetical protein